MKKLTKLLLLTLLLCVTASCFACNKKSDTVKAFFYSNNELIAEIEVKSGSVPDVSSIKTPEKAETETCTYKFVGWMPELGEITEDTVYAAVFKEEKKTTPDDDTVTATFYNGDELVATLKVKSGEVPDVSSIKTPEKAETETSTFVFSGWSPEVGAITADTTYVAQFNEVFKQCAVTFYSLGSVFSEVMVDYDQTVAAPATAPKYSDETRKFVGWSLDNETAVDLTAYKIKEETNFYALFELLEFSELFKLDFNLVDIDTDMTLLYGAIDAGAGQFTRTEVEGQTVLYLMRQTWGTYGLKFDSEFIKAAQDAGKSFVKITFAHIAHANGSASEFYPYFSSDNGNTLTKYNTGAFEATKGTATAEYVTGWFELKEPLENENCVYGIRGLSLEHKFYISEISFHDSMPQVKKEFNVAFYALDQKVSEYKLEEGEFAVAPETNPVYPDGTRKFVGWSVDKINAIDLTAYEVTADTDFYALFEVDYNELLKTDFNLVNVDTDLTMLYGAFDAGAGQFTRTEVEGKTVLYAMRKSWGSYALKFNNDLIKAAQAAGKTCVKVTYAHIAHANGSQSEFKPFFTDGTANQTCTVNGFAASKGTATAEYSTSWFTLDKELKDENCAYGFGSLNLEHKFYISEISFHTVYEKIISGGFNLVEEDKDLTMLYGAFEAGAGQFTRTEVEGKTVLYAMRKTWGSYALKFNNDLIKAAQAAGKIHVKVTYAHIAHANGSQSEFKPFFTDGTANQACTVNGFAASKGTATAEYSTSWFTLDKEIKDENCAYGFGSLNLEHKFYISEISFHTEQPA